jgi:hypothetical protein
VLIDPQAVVAGPQPLAVGELQRGHGIQDRLARIAFDSTEFRYAQGRAHEIPDEVFPDQP